MMTTEQWMNSILCEIKDVEALIAEHESRIAGHQDLSLSLRASLASLEKRLKKLKAEVAGEPHPRPQRRDGRSD